MNNVIKTHVKFAAGIALGGALFAASAGVAGAEPMVQDENLSLSIGEVTVLESADLEKATEVAGAVCSINATQANTIAEKASTETTAQTVCDLPAGAVTFSQASSVMENLPGSAPAGEWQPDDQMTPANPGGPMVPGSPTDTVDQIPS